MRDGTLGTGEDLRKVNGFELLLSPAQEPLKVHQATGIVRDQVFGAGFQRRAGLGLSHSRGDHREFDGKGSPEPAAACLIFHFNESQVSDSLQQLARLTFDVQFAQAMTAIVKSDLGREPASQIGDPELIDQE